MKLQSIKSAIHADSTDPIIRQAHEAAMRTRSAAVVDGIQRTVEAYLSESTARHQAEGGYGYDAADLVSRRLAELAD